MRPAACQRDLYGRINGRSAHPDEQGDPAMNSTRIPRLVAVLVLAGATSLAGTAHADDTARQAALADGAQALTPDQIAERFVGRTGTWVAASGDKTVEVYYGPDNDLHGNLVGGGWTGSGLYGVATDGRLCIAWDGSDDGRLRCLDVLVVDGTVVKYNPDGSRNGHYTGFTDGKAF
jgi:hypothetical protein